MMLDGLGREAQALGDLGVGQTLDQEGEDVGLASGKAGGVGAAGAARTGGDGADPLGPEPPAQVAGGGDGGEAVEEGQGLALSRLAHQAVSVGDRSAEAAFAETLQRLAERERSQGEGIGQCPGRSPRHRRQLFIRLLRARNLIDHGPPAALDLAALAAVANLSPSHFLRLFHRVFGISPHRYLVRQRMAEARRLVEETTQPIGSIAACLGFINRCAFARLFKQHHGTPATRLRRQALVQTRRRLARPVVLTMVPGLLRGDVGRT